MTGNPLGLPLISQALRTEDRGKSRQATSTLQSYHVIYNDKSLV